MLAGIAELKKHPEIIRKIDWEITPREAFESFQLRSTDNWKAGGLGEAYYFYVSTWKGESRLLLIRRTYVESEEIAEIDAPAEMMRRCIDGAEAHPVPKGQLPLSEELKDWLQGELGK